MSGDPTADNELGDGYFKIKSVIERRVEDGEFEFKVRWKGCDENSWIRHANLCLCSTAWNEAKGYT